MTMVPIQPLLLLAQPDLLEKLQKLVKDSKKKLEDVELDVQHAIKYLPYPYNNHLEAALKLFKKAESELWPLYKKISSSWGNFGTLRAAADKWSSIAKDLDEIRGEETQIKIHWAGDAADAYCTVERGQREHLKDLSDKASNIAAVLDDASWDLVLFIVGIILAWAAFIAELVVALASTSTVVGAPIGLGAALAAVVTVFGGIGASITYLIFALAADTRSFSRMDLGDWPGIGKAAGPMGDGSVVDGDESGWKID